MPPAYDLDGSRTVPDAAIKQFEADGAICLRNVIDTKTIDALRAEADDAVANPSAKIADAAHEATGSPLTNIWINFEEVNHDDFFVGHDSLAEIKAGQTWR